MYRINIYNYRQIVNYNFQCPLAFGMRFGDANDKKIVLLPTWHLECLVDLHFFMKNDKFTL